MSKESLDKTRLLTEAAETESLRKTLQQLISRSIEGAAGTNTLNNGQTNEPARAFVNPTVDLASATLLRGNDALGGAGRAYSNNMGCTQSKGKCSEKIVRIAA